MLLKSWRPYFIIFVLGFLLFYQTLSFDITYLDDQALLLDNAVVLETEGIEGIFSSDAFFSGTNVYYRPILNLSFWTEIKLGGPGFFVSHFFNILIHIITACLVFLVFKKLKYKKGLSFLASLIFLFHPALTQAVAWIPGRNDSLLTLFVLTSFLMLLEFLEKGRLFEYLMHILFILLALLTKETAVFAFPVFLLYIIFLERKKLFSFDNRLLYLAWIASFVVYFLIRSMALAGGRALDMMNLWGSLIDNLSALVIACGKIFFPFNLKVLPNLIDSSLWYGVLAIGLIVVLLVITEKKNRKLVYFSLSWFILFLLPSLLLQDKSWGVNFHLEHRIYLPIIGVLLLIFQLKFFKDLKWGRRQLIVAGLVLLFLIGLTFNHSRRFDNGLSFWREAVRTSPSSAFAHKNLGVMYYFNDNSELAEQEYRQALILNREESMAHNNLGIIYKEKNQLVRAEEEFMEELKVNPYYDKALFNLAQLYVGQGHVVEARALLIKTLESNPRHVGAYNNLLILENKLR